MNKAIATSFPRHILLAAASLSLAACQQSGDSGDTRSTEVYSGIAEDETVRFGGNEPFWGGEVRGETLVYSTPDDIEGTTIPVERFAGNNGISFSGTLNETSFDLMITPGTCSDTMSDRTYALVATLKLGDETRMGCAWSDSKPFTGPGEP